MPRTRPLGLWLALLLLIPALPLGAQPFPGFGGVEGRVGAVFPDGADVGLSTSADLELGWIGSPVLRALVGFHYFDAGVTHTPPLGGPRARGSVAGTGGRLGLRLDAFGPAAVGPYLIVAATAHGITVDADTDNEREQLDQVYGGFVIGGALGGGLHYALDRARRFVATAEIRRVFVTNLPHWSAELGVRIVARGRAAYDRPLPVYYTDPYRAVGVPATEAEWARRERERLEAERRRAEQERLARMTDEERRQSLAAAAAAEEAERRAAEEAAARAAAAAEADRAREEADRARAEAELAEQRAREADDQLYTSLLDLARRVPHLTAIRETERGLTLVLGQGLFAVGQATLSPAGQAEVQHVAAVLLQYPQYRILVEGHTDATGAFEPNQRLSEQRAMAVRAALVAQGIAPERIEIRGYGPALPIADNQTEAGRAQNRRVEVVLLGAQRPAARPIP